MVCSRFYVPFDSSGLQHQIKRGNEDSGILPRAEQVRLPSTFSFTFTVYV